MKPLIDYLQNKLDNLYPDKDDFGWGQEVGYKNCLEDVKKYFDEHN